MSNKVDLIRKALNEAETNLRLIKQLLVELDSDVKPNVVAKAPASKELPGITGIFDGEGMQTETGEKYPVPENYASKSLLIVGDTLKLVEEQGAKRFKQIEHVKRHKSLGILTKKDGKWRVVTPEGSYRVLSAAVSHFGGEVGDEVALHIPAGNLSVSYGAIESVINKSQNSEKETSEEEIKPTVQEVKPQSKKEPQNQAKKPVKQAEKSGHNKQETKAVVAEKPKSVKEVEYKEVAVTQPKPAKVTLPPVKSVPDEDELT